MACIALAFHAPAVAGAWLQAKGEGLIISGSSVNRSDLAFNADGKLETPVNFEKIDSNFYIEYGVSDRLTLVGTTALQDIAYTSSNGPQQYSGFSTSKIGMRYGLKSGSKWALAVQPSLVVPAGGEAIPDGDLGLGGLGGEVRALAGKGFTWQEKPGFLNVESAYDWRSGGAPRQITTDLTLGLDITHDIQILGQAFYRHTSSGIIGRDTVLANESLKLQASIVVPMPKLRFQKPKEGHDTEVLDTQKSGKTRVQIGYFQTVAGRNIVRERGALLSLWNEF